MAAALAVAGMVLSLAPGASADDLHDRKHKVSGQINDTLSDLDQSSAQLMAADDALQSARSQLAAAETHLATTQGELAAAKVLDVQMQRQLEAAVRQLTEARAELASGQAQVAVQERLLGQIAVQNYQTGDPSLLGLSMVLTSQDPAELTGQLNSVQNVLDKEAVALDRLEATKVLLTVQEEEVEEAKERVAVRREAAAANLRRKRSLAEEAQAAEERVADLVRLRADAQAAAVQAREADLERLRGLQQERDRIAEMLRQLAEEARQRALAAAAAASAAAMASDGGSRHSNGFLDFPVDGSITSSYGMRFHPVYHRWALHDGTDFGVACGTPIHAAASGTVIATYFNTGYGNRVIMDNGYHRGVGLGTAYNHLSAYSTSVGEKVKRGDVIGYVGSTGFSTGCHLHFMVFENGVAVNPMQWL
ncbi:MAG TPA: peptidoglycan DD-metalloendopeptidase family protein [Nocardioidaceae bacterium]|nr:peptidoglycan DD-metalloendopeptidase family protein [Nocardioidaceae bacterium]